MKRALTSARINRKAYTIGSFAVVIVKPRKGGKGLKYTVPMSVMPKLGQINNTIPDPLGRYDAVMAIPDLYAVEPSK